MGDRCTGACCQCFVLPFSPGELRQLGEAAKAMREWSALPLPRPPRPPHASYVREDIDFIADMAIFLAYSPSPPREVHHRGPLPPGLSQYWYTCRHLTPSGDCAAYATRPPVCRNYPYSSRCEHVDCTWDAARDGKVRLHEAVHRRSDGHVALRVVRTFRVLPPQPKLLDDIDSMLVGAVAP